MAQTFTKMLLSGSTSGRLIKVAATTTPGTLIHTAHATNLDEIWLLAVNSSASNVKLTIEKGGTTSPDDTIEITVPAESGEIYVLSGALLTGGLIVRAFAATTNVVMIDGFVNRIA